MVHSHDICHGCIAAVRGQIASTSRRILSHQAPVSSASCRRFPPALTLTRFRNNHMIILNHNGTSGFHTLSHQLFPRSLTRSHKDRQLAAQELFPEGEDADPEEDVAQETRNAPEVTTSTSDRPFESSSVPSVPWFLQENVIDVEIPDMPVSAKADELSTAAPLATAALPENLPATLHLLYNYLITGPSSGLLYKPSFIDQEDEAASPVAFIHVSPLQDGLSWCDWVTVITVRENNGGGINEQVARDVGQLLSRVGPPPFDESGSEADSKAQRGLDDILGPNENALGTKDAYGPKSTQRVSRDFKMTRKSDEEDEAKPPREPPPQWALQKQALAAKFDQWRPLKILSHETQSGLRILHSSDPEKWTASFLSSHFKISVEAVRRILKAKPERWGGDAIDRGLRRMGDKVSGPERWKREEEEIERLRSSLARDAVGEDEEVNLENEVAPDAEAAFASSPPPLATTPALDVKSLGKPRFTVRYEGFSSSRPTGRRARAATVGKAARNVDGEQAGEWVLVDAGWCVVHVMTPKAKGRYDVEGIWRDVARQQEKEDAEEGFAA